MCRKLLLIVWVIQAVNFSGKCPGLREMPNTATRPGVSRAQPAREILIFANPIAGRGRGHAIARRLEARLISEGYAVHTYLDRSDEFG